MSKQSKREITKCDTCVPFLGANSRRFNLATAASYPLSSTLPLQRPSMLVLSEEPRPKKRSRDSCDSLSHHSSNEIEHRAKRKRTKRDGYTGHWPPGFWDSLSKVHLTRGALREFERRTYQKGFRRAHSRPRTHDRLIASTEPRGRQLTRFSRHGGPDLSHLRGVGVHSPSQMRFSLMGT